MKARGSFFCTNTCARENQNLKTLFNFALTELCSSRSGWQRKECARLRKVSVIQTLFWHSYFAKSGGVGSANEIEAKSLYPLMHTFHLSPLLLLHFHHLSLGLYPITPGWNYYSNFFCPRVFSWSSKWDELGLAEVVVRSLLPAARKAGVRSIRGGAEKWDRGWWEKWGSPVGQSSLSEILLSYIFGDPENNRLGTSDIRGVKLCRIRKLSNGQILRMERWGGFFFFL